MSDTDGRASELRGEFRGIIITKLEHLENQVSNVQSELQDLRSVTPLVSQLRSDSDAAKTDIRVLLDNKSSTQTSMKIIAYIGGAILVAMIGFLGWTVRNLYSDQKNQAVLLQSIQQSLARQEAHRLYNQERGYTPGVKKKPTPNRE